MNQSKYKKVTKIAKPTNKNIFFTNFGDLCNKQPIVPSLPEFYAI